PSTTTRTAEIIAEAVRQNCAIYTVTLGFDAPQSLKDISLGTGGNWFDGITSLDQIRKIYREILHEAQSAAPCEITWQSGTDCSNGERSVSLTWNGLSETARFTPPSNAVVNLAISPASMFILSKPLGIGFDTTITVTAQNGPVPVVGITSSS